MNMFLPQQKDKDGGKMKALNNVYIFQGGTSQSVYVGMLVK